MRIHGLLGLVAAGVLSATALAEAPAQRGVELIVPGNAYVKHWERDGYDQFLDIGVKQRDGQQVVAAELRVETWQGDVTTVAEVIVGSYSVPVVAFEGEALPVLVSLAGMRELRWEPAFVDSIIAAEDPFPLAEGGQSLTLCDLIAPVIFPNGYQDEHCSVTCTPRGDCVVFELSCNVGGDLDNPEICTRETRVCAGNIVDDDCWCRGLWDLPPPPVSYESGLDPCPGYMSANEEL